MVVMRLVVFVPLIAGVHPIEVLRLARPVLVMPPVYLHPVSLLDSIYLAIGQPHLAMAHLPHKGQLSLMQIRSIVANHDGQNAEKAKEC